MNRIAFLLDEHIDPDLRRGLLYRQPDMMVWCIGDPGVPPRGTGDADILLWCEREQAVLVTKNRASMPVHLQHHLKAGRHLPGIFVLNERHSMGVILDELVLIWLVSRPDEYADVIWYLPMRSPE